MWVFDEDNLERALSAVGDRWRQEGHPPATVDLLLRGVRVFLRSPEAAKLHYGTAVINPLPLLEVEEIEPEEVTCVATGN